MNRKLIFFGSLLLGLILTVWAYLSFDVISAPFKSVPLYLIFAYIFVVLLIHTIHTWRWSIVLNTMNHKVPFFKLLLFRIMGFSLNYITPTAHIGGEPLKAAMLKENKIQYSDGVSSIFIDKSLEIASDGFFAITGLILIVLSFALPQKTFNNFLLLSLACVFLLIWTFFNLLKRKNPLYATYKTFKLDKVKFLKKFEEGVKKTGDNVHSFFVHQKPAFRKSVALSLLMWILMFVEYKLLFLMLGFDATVLQLFVIISFVGLAYFIPVPAALGVLEVGQLTAFSILGLSAGLGISAAIIIRAKDLLVTFGGLISISVKGIGMVKSVKEAEESE